MFTLKSKPSILSRIEINNKLLEDDHCTPYRKELVVKLEKELADFNECQQCFSNPTKSQVASVAASINQQILAVSAMAQAYAENHCPFEIGSDIEDITKVNSNGVHKIMRVTSIGVRLVGLSPEWVVEGLLYKKDGGLGTTKSSFSELDYYTHNKKSKALTIDSSKDLF